VKILGLKSRGIPTGVGFLSDGACRVLQGLLKSKDTHRRRVIR